MRIIAGVAGKAHALEPAFGDGAAFIRRDFVDLEPEGDVVDRVAPRHQPVALEDDAELAAEPGEVAVRVVTLDAHLAGGRLDEPGEQVEHGRFAAAGLAKHHHYLAALAGVAKILHRLERAAVRPREGLADTLEDDLGIRPAHTVRSAAGR